MRNCLTEMNLNLNGTGTERGCDPPSVNGVYWKHPRCPVWGTCTATMPGYGRHCQTQSRWVWPSLLQDPTGPLPPITAWQGSQPCRPCSSVSNLQALLPVSLELSQPSDRVKELRICSSLTIQLYYHSGITYRNRYNTQKYKKHYFKWFIKEKMLHDDIYSCKILPVIRSIWTSLHTF